MESLGPSLRLELRVKKGTKCFCDELALTWPGGIGKIKSTSEKGVFLLLSECQDRRHWITSSLSSSALVRSTRISSGVFPRVRWQIHLFWPTSFTFDIRLSEWRLQNANIPDVYPLIWVHSTLCIYHIGIQVRTLRRGLHRHWHFGYCVHVTKCLPYTNSYNNLDQTK